LLNFFLPKVLGSFPFYSSGFNKSFFSDAADAFYFTGETLFSATFVVPFFFFEAIFFCSSSSLAFFSYSSAFA